LGRRDPSPAPERVVARAKALAVPIRRERADAARGAHAGGAPEGVVDAEERRALDDGHGHTERAFHRRVGEHERHGADGGAPAEEAFIGGQHRAEEITRLVPRPNDAKRRLRHLGVVGEPRVVRGDELGDTRLARAGSVRAQPADLTHLAEQRSDLARARAEGIAQGQLPLDARCACSNLGGLFPTHVGRRDAQLEDTERPSGAEVGCGLLASRPFGERVA